MPDSLTDYEALAAAVLPAETYDFIAGGSGTESTLNHNRTSLDSITLTPRVLAGVSSVDTSWNQYAMPVVVAPMAYQRLLHPEGELLLARAAAGAGVPYAISTLSSYPLHPRVKHW